MPWAVAAHLAGQLGIADPGVLKQYAAREGTNRLHAGEIQRVYGYRDFVDPAVQLDLIGWLEARTRLASERPGVLFDLATARLLEAKVLLPGPTVLARLVASVRGQVATRLWQALAAAPDAGQMARLDGLLVIPAGERSSPLDRLRRGPTSVTAAGLLGALDRLEEIRALGVGELDLSFAPPGRRRRAGPARPVPGRCPRPRRSCRQQGKAADPACARSGRRAAPRRCEGPARSTLWWPDCSVGRNRAHGVS